MSATSLIAVSAIVLEVLPIMCHRLITNPYPDQEWDSVIVSSDPITIREKKQNQTTPLKLKQILKPQKRSFDECPQNDFKCLYGDSEDKNSGIVDKFLEQYSNIADVKFDNVESERNFTEGNENENPGKSYWSIINSQSHNHPYDDKKNWVTLDPVPWSTSKIAKWHPNKAGGQQENKPWAYGSTTPRPAQQFWVSGSSLHNHRPTSHWGLGTNDLITDNKPSDFPTAGYNSYGNRPQGTNYHTENGLYEYPGNYNDQGFRGNQPPKFHQTSHPSTYPNYGNGEWVLLSTTKGYSFPQQHKWAGKPDVPKLNDRPFISRNIRPVEISRYHEEDLSDNLMQGGTTGTTPVRNRKSDENVSSEGNIQRPTGEHTSEEPPLQVLYTGSHKTGEPVRTVRRKVRLQVLPSLENSSTSHGGLLEVDSNSQTVDEAQQEDEKIQKLKGIANVKKNKIRGYKLVPLNKVKGKGMNNRNMMTLAAVGAGMIPATMALLVPMALGRRRRSLVATYRGLVKVPDEKIRAIGRW